MTDAVSQSSSGYTTSCAHTGTTVFWMWTYSIRIRIEFIAMQVNNHVTRNLPWCLVYTKAPGRPCTGFEVM